MKKTPHAVVFIGHGSRNKNATTEFLEVVNSYAKNANGVETHYGFVELEKPAIIDTLFKVGEDPEIKNIVLIPLFLFSSRHVKNDIPILVEKLKKRYPQKNITCADTIKSHPFIIDLIEDRIKNVIGDKDNKKALLMVGRGSSDPDSNSEFTKIVRLVEERGQYQICLPSFIGITKPLVEDGLDFISRVRPDELIIVPYFLFAGRLVQKLEKILENFKVKYPWIKIKLAHHIGAHPKLFEFIQEKVEQALGEKPDTPLACLNCQYRPQTKELANNIKGTDALLWSVRHLYTHSQAKPHEFPHKNLKKHVLVCGNIDCSKKGSLEIITQLRRFIRDEDKQQEYRITKTSCMGRCGEGPSVVVYPDGVWYRELKPEETKKLYVEHMKNGQILSERVDDIMM
ncbi:MAG: CbiX/SirB N-terminal domain-containing protein [Bacteriovoracaceae bacterium]